MKSKANSIFLGQIKFFYLNPSQEQSVNRLPASFTRPMTQCHGEAYPEKKVEVGLPAGRQGQWEIKAKMLIELNKLMRTLTISGRRRDNCEG